MRGAAMMRWALALALALALLGTAPALAQSLPTPTFGMVSMLNGPNVLDTRFRLPGSLENGVIASGGGNIISYCPTLSCGATPGDYQRTSLLVAATTQFDGEAEEQTLAIQTDVRTGAFTTWAPSTTYATGANINSPSTNAVYRAITGGVSASSGTGPSGTGASIPDGTVVWKHINEAFINAKLGIYNEVIAHAGAGNTWGAAFNVQRMPGSGQFFTTSLELDMTNNSGAYCSLCTGLQFFMGGTHKTQAAIAVAPNSIVGAPAGGASNFGLIIAAGVASNADIELGGNGQIGVSFGGFVRNSYTTAAVVDYSTGPNGWIANGTKTSADFVSITESPVAYNNTGNHSIATFADFSTSSWTSLTMTGGRGSSAIADTTTGPAGLVVTGAKTIAAILLNETSPAGIDIAGNRGGGSAVVDASTAAAGVTLSGTYSLTAINTNASTASNALLVKSGQNICFANTDKCFKYVSGKLVYTVGGVNMFSVSDTGNAIFRGTVTASGTP